MIRKILIGLMLLAALSGIVYIALGSLAHFEKQNSPKIVAIEKSIPGGTLPPPPPPMVLESSPTMSFNVAGMSVVISEQTPWESIFKLMFIILGTYVGIRLTNKYLK